MAEFISVGLQVFGMVKGGIDAKAEAEYNAKMKEAYGRAQLNSAAQDEASLRRSNRSFLGEQAAAIGQSGLQGPSSDAVMRQSAVDAELDALNIRYQGKLKASGLDSQAALERFSGKKSRDNSNLMAGAALVKGYADYRKN